MIDDYFLFLDLFLEFLSWDPNISSGVAFLIGGIVSASKGFLLVRTNFWTVLALLNTFEKWGIYKYK